MNYWVAAHRCAGPSRRPIERPGALITLWLDGGPSQLETYDMVSLIKGALVEKDIESYTIKVEGAADYGLYLRATNEQGARILRRVQILRPSEAKKRGHTAVQRVGYRERRFGEHGIV